MHYSPYQIDAISDNMHVALNFNTRTIPRMNEYLDTRVVDFRLTSSIRVNIGGWFS